MSRSDDQERFHSNALERVSDAIVGLNEDLEYTFLNARAEQLLGVTDETLRGRHVQAALPAGSVPIAEAELREALETGQARTFERYSEELDRWFEVRVHPDEDGVSVFFTDVSERKGLERTSEFFRETQEVAHIGGWEFDLRSETLRWSDEVYRIHGLPLDADVSPEDGIEFYHPADRDTIRDAFDRLVTDGEAYDLELRLVTADEEVRWVRTRGEPRYENGEVVIVRGTFQDITERKERQEELVRRERLLDALFEFAPVHLFVKDDDCRHLWMSSALVEDPDRYIGKRDVDVDGGAVDEFSSEALADDRRVIEEERRFIEIEEYNEMLDRWFLTSKVPWYDDDGSVAGLLGYSVDITERKERERELQRQNERLDEFASVVSHDLRSPLTVAQGRTAILRETCDEEHLDHLDSIADSLDRMERIIEDTLTLARQGEAVGEMSEIPVVDLVGKCWAGVETAEATLEIDDEFTIRGDPDRLRHVFENLFRNAVEHAGDDVTVRVGRAGESRLYVEDDGPGIPEEQREEVLEAGRTSATEGTGFGLTIVKRIAEAHGWEVAIIDGRDDGARFEFDNAELLDT